MTTKNNGKRGFAAMDQDKLRKIASMGGTAAHRKGMAHEFTPEEAREAGRKGGAAVGRDRAYMAAIGRRGGRVSGERRQSLKSAAAQASATNDKGAARPDGEVHASTPNATEVLPAPESAILESAREAHQDVLRDEN